MPEKKVNLKPATNEVRKNGAVVGITDRIYDIPARTITFAEVLVKGDLTGTLEYNGRRLQIIEVNTITGLKVDQFGARGPLWEGVRCEVIE